MYIINFTSNTNFFTKITYSFLKLEYNYFNDLDNFLKNFNKINSDFCVVIYRDFAITNDFVKNLDLLKNIKENCILHSNNIYNEELIGNNEFIVDYKPFQNTNLYLDKFIYGFIVNKNELKKLLEDETIKSYQDLTNNISFTKIINKNLLSKISLSNNLINVDSKLFFNNFRNKKNIENLNNLISSYNSFINTNKKNNDKIKQNTIIKIYNELNTFNINLTILYDNLNEGLQNLINKYQESVLNNKYNKLYIINPDKKTINVDNVKSNIIQIENFKDSFCIIQQEIDFNYDIYFINELEKFNNIKENKKNNIIFNSINNKLEVFKMNSIFYKFFIVDFKDCNDYIEKIGNILFRYNKYEILILNDPINKKLEFKKYNLIPNIKIIDELYENKIYDESCYLINFIIKNKFSFNYTFIFKTLAMIDKVNYIISKKEIDSLINLLNFDDFGNLFEIGIVLICQNFNSIAFSKFEKFISENDIKEEHIIKFIYLVNTFKLLQNEIDISRDMFVIKHIINNFEFLKINYNKILDLDKTIDIKKLWTEILIYLNNRSDLIQNNEFNEKVSLEISSVCLDFNKLYQYNESEILDNFIKNPKLMINGCYSLSDFMMSEEDILLKRKNLLKLTNVIEKNFDKLTDKFTKMIKNNENISLLNLFRYAYHGIPNRDLFKNCVNITYKFNKLKYDLDSLFLKEKNSELNDDTKNIFYYKPKETNKKKICFLSQFLSRKHSVFKDRHQVILNLVKKGFEVYVATFTPLDYKHTKIYFGIKENIVLGNTSIFNMVMKLRSYKFDKLVFCEIGMDNRVTEMAHYRMANKQYNTWGHSDTSGYQHIDYFVSSELYELPFEESKNHYSEKLILQKGMCTSYVNPTSCYILTLPRSFYGLSDFEKVICCPQSLFKIHPCFDDYIFEILKRNKDVSIVFLDNHAKKFKMYERWNKILKDKPEYYGVLSRVKFLPGQDHQKFCNLMKVSDLLIDPYPFGGCNSSLESFSLGKPLVTQPSNRINGRFTYGFYKKMEFSDLIANNKEEYINLVTKLLSNNEFYDNMVDKIKKESPILFQEQQTLDEWEELMAE
jgi:predicted O-linked N-acetylglucosamine transferase (SPINDLY family)